MEKKPLVLQVEKDVQATDRKTGKNFVFDRIFVVVNGLKISLKAIGTAYEVIHEQLETGGLLSLQTRVNEYDKEDGSKASYDQLYVELFGEIIPVKSDKLGKQLINKYLQT